MVSTFFKALFMASSLVAMTNARALEARSEVVGVATIAGVAHTVTLDVNDILPVVSAAGSAALAEVSSLAGAPTATTMASVIVGTGDNTLSFGATPTATSAASAWGTVASKPTALASSVKPTTLATSVKPTTLATSVKATTKVAAASGTSTAASTGTASASKGKEVVAYFGQFMTGTKDLKDYCADANLDTIVISFINKYWGTGGLPGSNHAGYCSGLVDGTDLTSCPKWEQQIKDCQAKGKKIFISLGGATLTDTIPSADKAQTLAENLWKLYGGGKGLEDKRPFKTAVLDGFDLDIENKAPANYPELIAAFRTLFKEDTSKTYTLSAAPQCPNPDASLEDAVNQVDQLHIQFYNNPSCATSNIPASAKAWSQQLTSKSTVGTKFFVGVPGDSTTNSAGSGYITAANLKTYIGELSSLSNFGGLMTWDAETATANTAEGGKSYLAVMKSAMA